MELKAAKRGRFRHRRGTTLNPDLRWPGVLRAGFTYEETFIGSSATPQVICEPAAQETISNNHDYGVCIRIDPIASGEQGDLQSETRRRSIKTLLVLIRL